MKQQYLWLYYDLGLKGDYKNLYAWLDSHAAKECGDNLAYINSYSFQNDIEAEIRLDLSRSINFNSTDRIYIITKLKADLTQGQFLMGSRRNTAPWTGFGTANNDSKVKDGNVQ